MPQDDNPCNPASGQPAPDYNPPTATPANTNDLYKKLSPERQKGVDEMLKAKAEKEKAQK
ncbi:Uu.00g062130.m01.CDS01 [Anthostomella pinea]|uniref:Uu.00g062130.m01.CDS01 n=1 Tax=Anthostomella pinea TaxID=933095 RepID=A0AAI8VUB7_9PEZI|nr:Uu.00g062130.m01.CDS01 [Anthostomella pinea]